MKMLSIEEIVERLEPLFGEECLQLIVLFGSHAAGRPHKRSDIDIAFLFDAPIDVLSLTNRVIQLVHTDNVDVIDLRRASPLLKFSAVKSGRLIYERSPGIFNDFISLAFRMYVDTKKLRSAQEESVRLFLEARGMV